MCYTLLDTYFILYFLYEYNMYNTFEFLLLCGNFLKSISFHLFSFGIKCVILNIWRGGGLDSIGFIGKIVIFIK